MIATGARTTSIIEISPIAKTPLWKTLNPYVCKSMPPSGRNFWKSAHTADVCDIYLSSVGNTPPISMNSMKHGNTPKNLLTKLPEAEVQFRGGHED